MVNYWLMKSEPLSYSIEDLEKEKRTAWEGVRNYQARNYMRDSMKIGDLTLFYHSNANPSGVAGICEISKTHVPDHTSWDPKSKYFDPKSSRELPRWIMVELDFVERFPRLIALSELRDNKRLEGLGVLQKGCRLSIIPINSEHFNIIRKMGQEG
jgi:predicted RNA-binding protein with PUA-like domain